MMERRFKLDTALKIRKLFTLLKVSKLAGLSFIVNSSYPQSK